MDRAAREREGQVAYAQHRFQNALAIAHELARETGDFRYALIEADCAYHLHNAPRSVDILHSLIQQHGTDSTRAALLAYYLRAVGHFDESRDALSGVSPDTPGYSSLLGWHLLREGSFRDGMAEMEKESGIYREETRRAYPPTKKLRVGDDVRGLTILLILEGGFGDQILQARFAMILRERGARVIVECSPRLAGILSRMEHIVSAHPHGAVSPIAYDRYLPGQSAVGILSLDTPECPIPYLSATPEIVEFWKAPLNTFADGKRKIGIHWQGNWEFDWSEMKSPSAHLMVRLKDAGALISLQRDAGTNTIPADEQGCIFDAESGEPSWENTMAVIQNLDVVVSNCTSTAHVGAALGTPTILLAAHAPHYYWASTTLGKCTQSTPWYETMHVIRQPRYNDWEGAIDETLRFLKSL